MVVVKSRMKESISLRFFVQIHFRCFQVICRRGGDWFAGFGRERNRGTKVVTKVLENALLPLFTVVVFNKSIMIFYTSLSSTIYIIFWLFVSIDFIFMTSKLDTSQFTYKTLQQGLSCNASSVSFGHAEHCFLTVWTPKILCQNLLEMTFLRR